MSKVTLRHWRTVALTKQGRDELGAILTGAVRLLVPPEQVIGDYCGRFDRVCVARNRGRAVAFQFYRRARVNGMPVVYFALTAKAADWPGRGINRRMGRSTLLHAAPLLRPRQPFAIAAVIDNPRVYHDLRAVGAQIRPCILPDGGRDDAALPDARLYRSIASALAVEDLDLTTGMVPLRPEREGFDYHTEELRGGRQGDSDARFGAYLARHGGALGRGGVFVVAVTSVAASLRHQVGRRLGVGRGTARRKALLGKE